MDESPDRSPLPEGVNPSEVFLLDPANRPFLEGEVSYPAPPPSLFAAPSVQWSFAVLIAFVGLLGAGTAGKAFIDRSMDLAMAALVLFGIAAVVLMMRLGGTARGEPGRMEREGTILAARVMDSGFVRHDKDFFVSVRYLCLSPSGRSLSREESKIRTDFAHGKLPEKGTTVLILYLDDDHYRIL